MRKGSKNLHIFSLQNKETWWKLKVEFCGISVEAL